MGGGCYLPPHSCRKLQPGVLKHHGLFPHFIDSCGCRAECGSPTLGHPSRFRTMSLDVLDSTGLGSDSSLPPPGADCVRNVLILRLWGLTSLQVLVSLVSSYHNVCYMDLTFLSESQRAQRTREVTQMMRRFEFLLHPVRVTWGGSRLLLI